MPRTASLIVHKSPYSPSQTIEHFKYLLQEKGITVFATIDHAKAAQKVSLQLSDIQVLLFGDPKVGTFLMQENPEIGIELPLKILVWKDENQITQIGYKDPTLLGEIYGIKKNAEILKKMEQGLAQLVMKVIKGENNEKTKS